MKAAFFLTIFLSIAAHAGMAAQMLGPSDIDRVRAYKSLIRDVDSKSLNQTVKEIERTPHPHLNLRIQEAMARAYADIVQEKGVKAKNRAWLYSKISLNMAYLQFADHQEGNSKTADPLDVFIRKKLKTHLPRDIFEQEGFRYILG